MHAVTLISHPDREATSFHVTVGPKEILIRTHSPVTSNIVQIVMVITQTDDITPKMARYALLLS
jgi:hypothetical protein